MTKPAGILYAFLARDARRELSYPLTMALSLFSIVTSTLAWYFIARFVSPTLPRERVLGGDYFSFLVFGGAFLQFLQVSLFSFASNLREEQLSGTLEMLLSTPQRDERLILCLAAWDYLWQAVQVALLLGTATLFGLRWSFSVAGLPPAALLVALTLTAYVGIGLLAAAYTIAFKKGATLSIAAATLTTLFGGVFYPTDVLGPKLEWISWFVPATFVNHGLRTTLLAGGGWTEVGGDLAALALYAAILLPAGLLLFRIAVERARVRGDLTSY